jgi:hypothetical protein
MTLERRPLAAGTIITDALLAEISGVQGEVIDLEDDLYGFHVEALPEFRVARIRDMVALLRELKQTPNYYRAAVYLRSLVVRLCGRSFSGFLGAKNLRPEVNQLNAEIVKVLDLPFADRLKLSMRVLVRNVSALLLRPSLIDQVWTDAIDLAEIHVRGSPIANELRRSSHHALGSRRWISPAPTTSTSWTGTGRPWRTLALRPSRPPTRPPARARLPAIWWSGSCATWRSCSGAPRSWKRSANGRTPTRQRWSVASSARVWKRRSTPS